MFRGEPGDNNYITSSTGNHYRVLPSNHTLGTSGVSQGPRLSPDPLFALPSVGGQNPKGRVGRPKVGNDVVARVLALRSQGCGHKKISAVLGAQGVSVSPRTVGRIVRRAGTALSDQEDDGDE